MDNSIPTSIIPSNKEKWIFLEKLSEDLRTPIKKQLTEVVLNTFVPFFSENFIENNDDVLNWLLEDKSYFFQGRRGTGKSFYFIYAHKKLEMDEEIISIYLDLKEIFKSVPGVEKNHLIFAFYLKFFLILRGELLNRISIISQFLKTKKATLIDKIDDKINEIKKRLKEISYIEINVNSLEEIFIRERKNCDQKEYKKILEEINRKINKEVNEIYEKIKRSIHSNDDDLSFSIKELSRDFIALVEEIKTNFSIKIFLFIDEFSDIVPSRRKFTSQIQKIFVEHLLIPLTEKGVIFKIAVYPEDNFLTSNIFRDVKAEIKNIDLLYYIEDKRERTEISYKRLIEKGAKVLKKILKKKFDYYNSSIFSKQKIKEIKFEDLFEIQSENQFFKNLFQCVFGSVRNMGYIFYKISDEYNQEDDFKLITEVDIFNSASKYFEECERSLKSDLEKEMLFNMESYDIWQLIKKFLKKINIPSKNQETKGIFHVALVNISNDSKLQLRDIEGHSLINFMFTRSSKDSHEPLKLYVYRINQGFLLNNKWPGKYDDLCRAKKFSINKVFDEKVEILCDSNHEHRIDDLKRQSRSDNPNNWICIVYVEEKNNFCGSRFTEYIKRLDQDQIYSYKELSEDLEKYLRQSFLYHPSDSENVIDVLIYIYSQDKGHTSKEIATSKELERYELTAYQVAGYLRRNSVKDLIERKNSTYFFNKELFQDFINRD